MREWTITYFKSTGKYYTQETITLHDNKHLWNVCDLVREWNGRGELPGLQSLMWKGPIMVAEADGGPPQLLI